MSNLATITNNILADSGIDDINVVVTTGSYANPAWITSLAWSKITGAPLGDYLPLAGGTMTGNINWAQTDRGITWAVNTDGASIKFYNTGDGDTDSRLEFATIDNNNEYFRWVHIPSGGSLYESMRLVPNSSGNAQLIVSGNLGLGVTPSAWSLLTALQISGGASLAGYGGATYLAQNFYYGSGGDTYISNGYSTRYTQFNGQHLFFTAPSGTAGNAISFTQAMTLDASGRLGIGTTSPAAKLHAVGSGIVNIVQSSNTVSYTQYYNSSTGTNSTNDGLTVGLNGIDAYIFSREAGNLVIGTSDTERMRITSDGNVGIGTSSPARKLDVNGTSIFRDFTTVVSSNGNPVSNTTWLGTDSGITNIYTGGNPTVQLNSNGVSYFNGGDVGIGTTTPNPFSWASKTLTVASSATNSYAALEAYGNGTGAGAVLLGNTSILRASIVANDGSNLVFAVNASNTGSSQTERMRITASGYIGVASSSPVTRFTVNAYAGSRLPYINGTANTFDANGITVTSSNTANANIGGGLDLTNNVHSIGSFSPLISFSALTQSGTYNNNYAAIYGILAGDSGDGNWNTGHIAFATTTAYGTSEKVRITSAGNVGIGTTTPSYKLMVNGAEAGLYVNGAEVAPYTQKIAVFRYGGNGNSVNIENQAGKAAIQGRVDSGAVMDLILNAAGGNVGIGTGSPTNRLQISLTNGNHANEGILLQSPSGYGEGAIYHDYGQGNGLTAFKIWNSYCGSQINLSQDTYSSSGSPGSILFYTSITGGANTPVERMRIVSSGNVGIGVTNPAGKFEVGGGSGSNGVQSYFSTSAGWSAPAAGDASLPSGAKIVLWNDTGGNQQKASIGMDGSADIWFNNAGGQAGAGFTFYTGDGASATPTERLKITKAGLVGVGTASPSDELTVNSAGNSTGIAIQRSGVTKGLLEIGSSSDTFAISATSSTGILTFATNSSERMRITSDGNVGIGTTSPISKLTVDNTTNNIWLSINNGRNSGSSPTYGLSITTSHASSSLNDVNHYGAYIVPSFTTSSSNLGSVYGMFIQPTESGFYNIGYGYGLYVQAITVNSGTISNNYAAVFMGGNVGIGTVTPSYLLDVHSSAGGSFSTIRSNNGFTGASDGSQILLGNSANFTNAYFRLNGGGNSSQAGIGSLNIGVTEAVPMAFYTSNSERMRITSGGNVGIGTTSPTSGGLLAVGGNIVVQDSNSSVFFGTAAVGYGDSPAIGRASTNGFHIINSTAGDLCIGAEYSKSILFGTGTSGTLSQRMRITSAGEVWMGYTSDQGAYLLQVNGAVFASSYFESSDARLKNITNTYNGLDFGAIQYTWKDGRDAKLHWGYAAQDVMKYIPDAVNENKDGFLSLDYNQAHTYKIAMLENRIAELEKQLNNK
jgi:hypothetical protein